MMKRLSFSIALVLVSCGNGEVAQKPVKQPTPTAAPIAPKATLGAIPKLRLPQNVKPTSYALHMRMSPTDEKIIGTVNIDVEVKEPTHVIWIHVGDNLDVRKVSLDASTKSGRAERAPSENAGVSEDFVGLLFDEGVKAGIHRLTLEYEGKLPSRDGRGAYRQEERGDWYIFTQFESLDARRAFPCFDEPGFKTPYQITIDAPKDQLVFANTPQTNEKNEKVGADGYKTVTFAPSQPLPSYLVAFAVGPFEVVDAGKAGANQTPIRIIVPKGRSAEAKYAAETTGKVLEALEKYTDIPYPYEKLDHIAVPQKGGAMENPGLITYGTTTILGKPEDKSIRLQRGYLGIAAHELGHIWFGDYVTTAWWDDIWLNESFATWISAKIVDELHPEWDGAVNKVFSRNGIMQGDALVNARRIRQPIESKHDIANSFDGITYQKGGAVIGMMEAYVGEANFKRGVHGYLQRHQHGNATASDFLTDVVIPFPEALQKTFAPAYTTFLDQPGVPLLTAELACDPSGNHTVKYTQSRYLPQGSAGSASDQIWKIPVCSTHEENGKATPRGSCALVEGKTGAELLVSKKCPEWINPNGGATGYYRVQFTGKNGNDQLARLVKNKTLPVPDRLSTLGDALAFVRSGQMKEGDVLGLVAPLVEEGNRHLTSMTTGLVGGLSDMLVPDNLRPNYRRFVTKVYGAKATKLGLQPKANEDDSTRLLRPGLVSLVAREGEPSVAAPLNAEARKLTEAWIVERKGIDHDMIGLVMWLGARNADEALWTKLHEAAKTTKDRKERTHLLDAMGAVTDPKLIEKNFAVVLSDDFDPRESMTLFWGALTEPKNRQMAYDWMKASYDRLIARMPKDWGAGLAGAAGRFCDSAHRADAEAFFKERATKTTGGPRILAQVLEGMSLCEAQRPARQESVSAFLSKQ